MNFPGYYEFCCRVNTVAGHDALEKIPGLLKNLHAGRPMIITDKGVVAAGLMDVVTGALAGNIAIGSIEDDVPPDSDLKVVNRLARIYMEKGCDAIIAVGGGSVLDTAKGVNIVVSENAEDLMDFTGAGALKRRLKPLVAVPTTAGTGSEVTLVAVIANHEKKRKMAFTSYFLLPDIAIIDSRMTLTLPDFLTALTGMDALTHAMEAYICMGKNPISDTCAMEAIPLISNNLLHVVRNPADREGRLALATAATLAGMAFSNSMVGIVHTLGHTIGAICHVPHGTCMSILLPYGLEYNMHKIGDLAGELLYAMAGDVVYAKTSKEKRAEKTVEYVRALNQALHEATGGKHARCLSEIKNREGKPMISKDQLPLIAKRALGDGSLFYNPEAADEEDMMLILEAAWDGRKLDQSRVKKG